MTNKKKPPVKPMIKKMSKKKTDDLIAEFSKKPAAKHKPAVKRTNWREADQLNGKALAETAPAFIKKPVSGQGIIFDLTGSFSADDLGIANEVGYKAGKADARRGLTEILLFAFAAGGAAVAMVFVTLRHYGVF